MIEQDPRLTEGPTFFQSLYALLKRIIIASNTNETNVTGLGNTKVNRAGDTMTGGLNLVSPSTSATEANTDNSTRIATTAWVRAAMSNIASAAGFVLASNYVQLPSWLGSLIIQFSSSAFSGSTSRTVNYPLTFPNSQSVTLCFPVGASEPNLRLQTTPSTTSFVVVNDTSTTGSFYFIAVGR